jgi:hypothetical protein
MPRTKVAKNKKTVILHRDDGTDVALIVPKDDLLGHEPITVKLTLNGEATETKTDNLGSYFDTFDFEPTKLKSSAIFEVSYKDRSYTKVLNIPKMRKLHAIKVLRALLAKQFNIALAIPQ